MDTGDRELIEKMLVQLDAALPLLEAAAAREERQPARGGLKQITHKLRLQHVKELLKRAEARTGVDLDK
jgi:hypothetical protein